MQKKKDCGTNDHEWSKFCGNCGIKDCEVLTVNHMH